MRNLIKRYSAVLGSEQLQVESSLEEAYELGRKAITKGMGVMDMAKLHEDALVKLLEHTSPDQAPVRAKAAGAFFLEALTPFEATHRGFREAVVRLKQLNKMLERRNHELGRMNRKLEKEIIERKRSEAARRRSEQHYRDLFHQAQRMQEALRELSDKVLHAQEEERTRISRELHDEVGQALTAANVNLAMLKNSAPGDVEKFSARIGAAQSLLEQTMEAVHRFARELRPAMLDDLGLIPTLRSYLQAFNERTLICVRFQGTPAIEKIDGERKTVVYRVVQESLNNVAKHAGATRVSVNVARRGSRFVLNIHDNGKGFEVNGKVPAEKGQRLGLLGMQERLRLVEGELTVTSTPGKGTSVRASFPVKPR